MDRSCPTPQGAAAVCCENTPGTWIQSKVAGVVEEQIQLNLVVTGTRQKCGFECVGFRSDLGFVLHAVNVLPFSGLWLQEISQRSAVLRCWLLPVFLNGVPAFA